MKTTVILSLAILAAGWGQTLSAQSECCPSPSNQVVLAQGPGPVISGSYDYSKIPEKAKKFIARHFKGLNVMEVEKDFESDTYDVTMQNGVEVEFTSSGEVKEIEGLNSPLSGKLVKEILPPAAYKTLTSKILHNNVRKIEIERDAYEVKFVKESPAEEIKFDLKGNVLKIE